MIIHRHHLNISALILLMLFLVVPPAPAGGPAHGGKAAGMGTAFGALADDPSAITHNPAGIAFQEGTQLYLGAPAVVPKTQFDDGEGHIEKTKTQLFVAPHAYLTTNLEWNDVRLGLGLFSPFGIGGRTWPDDGTLKYFSQESLIATFMANPVVAWRLLPTLSIALGVDYLWTYNHAEQKVDQSALNALDGTSSLTADGDGWGWNLGLLWQLDPEFSIGAAYRSGITVDLSGDMKLKNIAPVLQPLFGGSEISSRARTSIDFPDIVTLSAAWHPSNRWTVVVEGEWVGWSSFQSQTITVDQPVASAGVGDIVIVQNWRDVWIAKAGTELKIDQSWALRAGYAYLTSPVPSATLTPANPDATQHNYCFGLGYTRDKITIDLFYVFALFQDRRVSNDILSGEYANQSHSFGFSLGWQL